MHLAGITPEEIRLEEDRRILDYGCGLTTVVKRPTASADQLSPQEFAAVAAAFERKIARFAPRVVAFLGKPAYSALSGRRDIGWGQQVATMGASAIWVLPNPSGRNRAFRLDRLVAAYSELHTKVSEEAEKPRWMIEP
jgi:TDG/mug DNA glycosylase family protein